MPKRRKISGDSLCKLLEENGFIPVRQRGSHRILQKILPTGTITVPVPIHKDIVIRFYYRDHPLMHFHAIYAEHEAL